MKQVVGWGVGVLVGLAFLIWQQWPDGKLHVVACDVGQGDAVLIYQGFVQVLVDGGPSGERVLRCLRQEMPFWDRRIELIVMSHGDKDHMSGLVDVIERYSVIEFLSGDGLGEGEEVRRLGRLLQMKRVTVEGVEQGMRVRLQDEAKRELANLRVWWPEKVKKEKLAVLRGDLESESDYQVLGSSDKRGRDGARNERSVVVELEWQGYRMLFTGDADYQAELAMIQADVVEPVDYIKVSHHGSKTASSLEFLERLRPQIAVISVGRNNRYGHPDKEVLERLRQVGAKILRTDLKGKVEVVVDREGRVFVQQ